MKKANLQPLFFTEANQREIGERAAQLKRMEELYGEEAEFLPEIALGSPIPEAAVAVVFPQLLGAVFSHKEEMARLHLPILVVTSEFGTVEMWDWEIVAYLKRQIGLCVFAPYTVDLAKVALRALAARQEMAGDIVFVMFQDDPGEGMQANIFKRFYWWEQESARQIEEAFGVRILYRSWKEVNQRAHTVDTAAAQALLDERKPPCEGVSPDRLHKAAKLYIAVKETLDEIGNVKGVGSNCLNESFLSDTTPCLAWNWIFEYDKIIWACEGDIVTLISEYILYSALRRPLMMTNIYPFLMGMAALKHEKIDHFPAIPDPDNHALGVHCGYFGLAPQSFCSHWVLRPKVLEIVGEDALMVDCRMKTGPMTMAKLHPDMQLLTIIEAEIEDYVQYPGTDCRNGALIRYKNGKGHRVMEGLSSHHAILIQGDVTPQLLQMAKVYGFETEVI